MTDDVENLETVNPHDTRTEQEVREDMELASRAVEVGGIGVERFARLTGRDERTIRRWRDGYQPVPPHSRKWLEQYLDASDADRARLARWFS